MSKKVKYLYDKKLE